MEILNLVFGIIIGLISLTFLVAIHELGHALAAKKNGVKLKEYAIGFPPRIKSFRAKTNKILPKNTKISIGAIPLGGFVRLKGEHDSDSKKGDYGAVSFWAKTQILFAGVAMNWLVAFVIFTILSIFGMPKLISNQFYLGSDVRISGGGAQVSQISNDSPAQKAGLQKNDIILEFKGKKVDNSTTVKEDLRSNAGKSVNLKIQRGDLFFSKDIKLNKKNNKNGFLGAFLTDGMQKIHSTWSAPIEIFVLFGRILLVFVLKLLILGGKPIAYSLSFTPFFLAASAWPSSCIATKKVSEIRPIIIPKIKFKISILPFRNSLNYLLPAQLCVLAKNNLNCENFFLFFFKNYINLCAKIFNFSINFFFNSL